jgi:uncharacterized protein YjbJ (UPF0337 family)
MADDTNRDGLENRIKGIGKQAEGKIRDTVGGLTGDKAEQIRGKAKNLEGKVQRKIGEAESSFGGKRDRNSERDRDRGSDLDP